MSRLKLELEAVAQTGGTHLLPEVCDGLLYLDKIHTFEVPQNRSYKALWCRNRNAQIDIIAIDDRIAFNTCVRRRNLFQRQRARLCEGAHETELNTVLLQDFILVQSAELLERGHVDLIECCKEGGGILRLLQTLGNAETHAAHLHTRF